MSWFLQLLFCDNNNNDDKNCDVYYKGPGLEKQCFCRRLINNAIPSVKSPVSQPGQMSYADNTENSQACCPFRHHWQEAHRRLGRRRGCDRLLQQARRKRTQTENCFVLSHFASQSCSSDTASRPLDDFAGRVHSFLSPS